MKNSKGTGVTLALDESMQVQAGRQGTARLPRRRREDAESEGRRFLTLEFVDGETPSQRLARGAMPAEEALEVCRQIAAGVEAAHKGGVIHRDLKPGNVKIAANGEVKVLDFGLAKGGTGSSSSGPDVDLSHSPTLTYAATAVGVILGTAAYMSPEQARGKAVDRRTDIWSFGCVNFFEQLKTRMSAKGVAQGN